MSPPPELEPRTLSRILLLQSMIGQFDSEASAIDFACRGLEGLPGVLRVEHVEQEEASRIPEIGGIQWFSLKVDEQSFGSVVVECSDHASFEPYRAYVANLCFMLALILTGIRRRELELSRRSELERKVEERTEELTQMVRQLESAREELVLQREKAERYLEMSEAIILELDTSGSITVINKRGAELLGRPIEELIGESWFDVAIAADQRDAGLALFSQLIEVEEDGLHGGSPARSTPPV